MIINLPQVTFQTELGQMLDLITAPPEQVDFSKFTLEKSVSHNTYVTDCVH